MKLGPDYLVHRFFDQEEPHQGTEPEELHGYQYLITVKRLGALSLVV